MPPLGPLPTATVVICTRDRPEALDRCLASIVGQRHAPVEILVVDNAPLNDRTRRVAERFGTAYLLEPRPGVSRARNAGVAASRAEVVAFIDDDAVAAPDWLALLLTEFTDPAVGCVTGKCLALTDGPASAAMEATWSHGNERRSFPPGEEAEVAVLRGVVGVGMNMAFRRELLDGEMPFHLRLGRGAPIRGAEELLAFLDVLRRDGTIVYTPAARVRHPVPETLEAFQEFKHRSRADTVAWLCFLLCEAPPYRAAAWRVVRDLLAGRSVAGSAAAAGGLGGGRWSAACAGGLAYLRALGAPVA